MALRGAWGWRRAPGGGGWSCGLGPRPHCSQGWRGRWRGSPPTGPLAGPDYSALPLPGPIPGPTPPLAVPGLRETETGLREGRRHRGKWGWGRAERKGPARPRRGLWQMPWFVPSWPAVFPPLSSRLRTPGGGGGPAHPRWLAAQARAVALLGEALWGPGPQPVTGPSPSLVSSALIASGSTHPPRRQPHEDQISLGAPPP